MPEIRAELEIRATPDRVWDVLTDFDQYRDWNPFLVKVTGAPAVGARLAVHVRSGVVPITFSTVVVSCDPRHQLRWRGQVLGGVVAGEHYFELSPSGTGTRFIHGERFTGRLAVLAWPLIERATRHGHALMNAALKARAEAPLQA